MALVDPVLALEAQLPTGRAPWFSPAGATSPPQALIALGEGGAPGGGDPNFTTSRVQGEGSILVPRGFPSPASFAGGLSGKRERRINAQILGKK